MSYRWCFLALLFAASLAQAAAPSAAQRRLFETAYNAAASGPAGRWQVLAPGLHDYPLYPYLEWAALKRDIATAKPAVVRDFLSRHADTPLAADLRSRWLHSLAAHARWKDFIADFDAAAAAADTTLQCRHGAARIALGRTKDLAPDATRLWLTGGSLPRECDPVIAWLAGTKQLTTALVWQRIDLAAAAGNASFVRHLAARLTAPERAVALRYATTLADPGNQLRQAAAWPDDARHRRLATLAIAQLARKRHEDAAVAWPALAAHFRFDAIERGRALAAIALWHAASYAPTAATWLAQVPADAYDDALREWRVREALARRNYADALAALELLAPAQKEQGRWRYVRARVLEELGRGGEAAPLLDALSTEATYHGFLAAERRGQPYSICPQDAVPLPASALVDRRGGLARAFELHALGWHTHARREWDWALRGAAPGVRRAAVEQAHARGWIDRGPLTLLAPEDVRLYHLRFPLAYEQEIRHHAKKNGIDAAWALAIIRSESAWMADAHSGANARGLMQLIPTTAQRVARALKVPYRGPADLFRPTLNITLGTRHLADELGAHGGRTWLATAAYNAGPTPVARWTAQRPNLPADLWVETIPYRETREYVSRVLSFSVIYDWRLNGDAAPLSSRLAPLAARPPARKQVTCAVTATVQAEKP